MSAKCSSCGAPILWATTNKGKRIPLDPEPGETVGPGLFVLAFETSAVPVARSASGRVLYRSHFATCPNADQHRRSA